MAITKISSNVQSVKQRFSIIGNSPKLLVAIDRALQVAPIDLSVLIIGESGAGKEFFPQIIHTNSARRHNKYIAVNCGAIPEGTIDSELFGHEKGAFTGAIAAHKGYFEEANGGTIFLDEVAELPLTTQARLLRVLESGEYMRVGSAEVKKTNIRVVAATNKDMVRAVKEGKFREDLYYRLSTVQINIPPLRDRGDDVRRYLPYATDDMKPVVASQASAFDYNRERELIFKMIFQLQSEIENLKTAVETGSHVAHINDDVAELKRQSKQLVGSLSKYKSPELKSIGLDDYGAVPGAAPQVHEVDATAVEPDEVRPVKTLEDTERETITRALERNCGRRKKTAEELNISERTLYRKIKEYGLESRNLKS